MAGVPQHISPALQVKYELLVMACEALFTLHPGSSLTTLCALSVRACLSAASESFTRAVPSYLEYFPPRFAGVTTFI